MICRGGEGKRSGGCSASVALVRAGGRPARSNIPSAAPRIWVPSLREGPVQESVKASIVGFLRRGRVALLAFIVTSAACTQYRVAEYDGGSDHSGNGGAAGSVAAGWAVPRARSQRAWGAPQDRQRLATAALQAQAVWLAPAERRRESVDPRRTPRLILAWTSQGSTPLTTRVTPRRAAAAARACQPLPTSGRSAPWWEQAQPVQRDIRRRSQRFTPASA
jgi:hypothetical protein